MAKIIQWRGDGIDANANYGGIVPGVCGRGDTRPFNYMNAYNPGSPLWAISTGNPLGSRVKAVYTNYFSSGIGMEVSDYSGVAVEVGWSLTYADSPVSSPISTWSMRFKHNITAGPIASLPQPVIIFKAGATEKFRIYLMDTNIFDSTQVCKLVVSGIGTSATQFDNFYTAYRFEIQVDGSLGTNKVRVRVYDGDSTTMIEEIKGNLADVAIDNFVIGSSNTNVLVMPVQYYGDIELHNDYTLGGAPSGTAFNNPASTTTGYPYVRPQAKWYEWNGTTETELTVDGIWNGTSIDSSPTNKVFNHEAREVVPVANTFYSNVIYAYGRGLDLWVPNGTPPQGGWPTVVFAHSGFFISNSRVNINAQFVNHCLNNGFAVASIDYILSTATPFISGGGYPSDAGKYPSWIFDYKLAVKHLRTLTAAPYRLDPARMIATGYSAGGYLAMAANVSRNLANDGGGRDLRLSGTLGQSYGGSAGDTDPPVLGSYAWAGPVNMQLAKDFDPTHPNFGAYDLGYGTIHLTARAFMGSSTPNLAYTGIDDFLTAQANAGGLANVKPIGYTRGKSDYLVHYAHLDTLKAACTARSIPLDWIETHEIHDTVYDRFRVNHFINWAKALL